MTSSAGGELVPLMPIVGLAAMLGSALIGGIFFAFSSFVMRALARAPAAEGIALMQSINVVVLNPSFLGAFIGTAVLSFGAGGLAMATGNRPSGAFFVGGATLYLLGTFLVTVFQNVPLNDRLAAVPAADPKSAKLWALYLVRWTTWNHVRTAAALAAALLFAVGLVQSATP